jgi:hypothetical protein
MAVTSKSLAVSEKKRVRGLLRPFKDAKWLFGVANGHEGKDDHLLIWYVAHAPEYIIDEMYACLERAAIKVPYYLEPRSR